MLEDSKKIERAHEREQHALDREHEASKSRQDTEDKFQLFVAAVKDYAIFMIGPDGEINSWNVGAEHLLGFKAEEALHKDVSIVYGNDAEAAHQAMETARTKGRAIVEGWRSRKNGSKFWAVTITTAVFMPDNSLHGYAEVTQDLTERKEHEQRLTELNQSLEKLVKARTEQLEAANKELEAFSYSVSHDLQAPLRSIDGFAKIMREDYAQQLEGEGLRTLEVISRNARRMRQLIDDLLAFSHLTRQPMKTSILELGSVAESVLCELREANADLPIKLTIKDKLPMAIGDEALMRQVFANLFSNAIKFSKSKGEVNIEFGGSATAFENQYYIKDNGDGFDMRYSHKLFAPFQRLHSAKLFEGNGIGLALVQRIVRRHGGRVWAESELDHGATFHFTLPNQEVHN